MEGFLVVVAFLVLFVLGFPVVLAIGIPCIVYIFTKDLPIDLVAQRTLYALDSFPLVAVPVFLFVGSLMNSAGISRYIYKFADTADRPPARRPRAGEHLRQPHLRGHVGLGAGRHRRPRPHRDRRDAQERLLAGVRRGGDELVGDRRADLSAVDPAHHLRHGDGRVGHPAPAGRHPAGIAVRRDADADDRLARDAPQLPACVALADDGRAVARLQARVPGDRGAADPDRRDARGVLHADRDRVGHGALRDPDQQPVLPRAHVAAACSMRRVRDDPRIGGHPADRRRRRAVRLDPVGRSRAAEADGRDARRSRAIPTCCS